jgi:hypothetical protein
MRRSRLYVPRLGHQQKSWMPRPHPLFLDNRYCLRDGTSALCLPQEAALAISALPECMH